MKYAIIGTGAIGGYYGGLLAKSGKDVHFLLRSDYEHVKEKGLKIDSKNGDFVLPKVNAYKSSSAMPKCDVVIIALKTTQNDKLKEIITDVVKENGIVVILQNGLGNEDDVKTIVPNSTIIGGFCFICSYKDGPGYIRHEDYGYMRIGQYSNEGNAAGITETLKLVHREFKESGIDVDMIENLIEFRWRKLVWNIPFNGLSVVLNTTTDNILKDPSSRKLAFELMKEVILGAKACGYVIEDNFIDDMFAATEKMVSYSPSMKLDFEKKRPLEIDQIYLRPYREAELKGYLMKATKSIALILKYMNSKNG